MTENHDVTKAEVAELGGFHSIRHLENIGFSLRLLSSQTLSSEPSIRNQHASMIGLSYFVQYQELKGFTNG